MRIAAAILILAACASDSAAQPPDDPSLFQLGVWTDDARTGSCVEGPVGTGFTMVAWGWVPDDLGLNYITFRFDFPPGVVLAGRPALHRDAIDLIVTDFADGTQEWNVLIGGCHSGWVRIFAQDCVVQEAEPGRIGIVADRCWMRDCVFTLNEVGLLGEIGVNEPGCGGVPADAAAWGTVKGWYR